MCGCFLIIILCKNKELRVDNRIKKRQIRKHLLNIDVCSVADNVFYSYFCPY